MAFVFIVNMSMYPDDSYLEFLLTNTVVTTLNFVLFSDTFADCPTSNRPVVIDNV